MSSATSPVVGNHLADRRDARRLLRIFISSPSDVRPERLLAKRLVERLDREFGYYFRVEPVLWEREPLKATEHFQASITPPRETDVVVVILWSRLGVPLPAEEAFRGAITQRQVTGTEWEFEDAVAAHRQGRELEILVYVKTAEVRGSLEDEAAVLQQLEQKRNLQDFLQRWFRDTESRVFKRGYATFATAADLEDLLGAHLRELLERRLNLAKGEALRGGVRWRLGSPFRGLESFGLEHAPVFFGRTRARNELRELLSRQAAARCAFVLVFGASGSGKSSLVKAGLLPDLKLPGMIGRVALCRHAVLRPAAAHGDLLGHLAASLLSGTALPELAGLQYDRTRLANLLREAPTQVGQAILQGLTAAVKTEHLTERAEGRLALVVDQLEELFTLDDLRPEERDSFVLAVDALARSGLVWVVATMRSDFFDRLDKVPALARLSAGEARYLLQPPTLAELGQIIREPAREAGLHFERDRERDLGLDDELSQAAADAPSALPLLEFTLDQLWQRRTDAGALTFKAYRQLGGLEGALGKRARDEFDGQPPEVQAALPQVLRALATVGQGVRGAVTARVVPLTTFPLKSPARALVDRFLDPEVRLLVAWGDEQGSQQVRVAHEALFTHWDRAREQLLLDRTDLQTRARVEQAAVLWQNATSADRPSRLLPEGLPLVEAEDLLGRRRDELDGTLTSYIEASSSAAAMRARRQRRRLFAAAAIFAALAVAASGSAFLAVQQRADAVAKTKRMEGLLLVVEKGASVHVPPDARGSEFRPEHLKAVMPGLSAADAEIYFPYLKVVMYQFGIDTPLRQSAFLANVGHESGDLKFQEEPWGPTEFQSRYEGRRDLGNTQPGDGKRFKGRGMLMVTGRANYQRFSERLGIDFVADPERMSTPEVSVLVAADIWWQRDLNKQADAGDIKAVRRRINGGSGGLKEVQERYERAKEAFGIAGPPAASSSTASPVP